MNSGALQRGSHQGVPGEIYRKCLKILDVNRHVVRKILVVNIDSILDFSSIRNIIRRAYKIGYYVFVVADVPPSMHQDICRMLYKSKVPYKSVFTKSYIGEHSTFSIDIRNKLSKVNPDILDNTSNTLSLMGMEVTDFPYTSNIIITIGNSWTDIIGDQDTTIGVKLPSEDDDRVYLYDENHSITSFSR
jgi:hypothetical protein